MWTPTHVQVTVSRAKGLKAKGAGGTNDVFVTVLLGDVQFKTSVKSKSPANQTVKWFEQCDLPLPSGKYPELQLTIHHQSFLLGDLFLGMVRIPLEEFDPYRSVPESKWYPLRSKPGQEHKMDYRGAVEIRVQFLVKSSMHSTPVLNSPSENSAAAKKSVSPEPRTSQTPSSTKYEDVTNLLKEPADTNVSVKTESFEASEKNSAKEASEALCHSEEKLEAFTADQKPEKPEDVKASDDNLQENFSPLTRDDAVHENKCTSEQGQRTDIPNSSSVEVSGNDSEAKPEINQRPHYQEYSYVDDSTEPATAENEMSCKLPQEINETSPNPFTVPANKGDSPEDSFQESMNSLPGEEQLLVESQHHPESGTMPESYKADRNATLESPEIFTRTNGEGEQSMAVHSKTLYESLPAERLVNEIVERDEVIAELKEYIDLLVLRVMDFCPGVLLHPVPSFKK